MKIMELPRQYRYYYRMDFRFGDAVHRYILVGRPGALDFWVRESEYLQDKGHSRYQSGLEIHWRSPPDHMNDQPPSHDRCWAIDAPCWHDGTSLYAEEHLFPMWQQMSQIPFMRVLASEANSRFNAEPEDEE